MSASLPYRFDDERRVISITDPRLPQPWINDLSNGDLHASVAQAGGGPAGWNSLLKKSHLALPPNQPPDRQTRALRLHPRSRWHEMVALMASRGNAAERVACETPARPHPLRRPSRDPEATLGLSIAPGTNSMICDTSGTAAWMDVAVIQYLLGIRPELSDLCLSPCLPTDWEGFAVARLCCGYEVHFKVIGNGAQVGLRLSSNS